MTGWELFQMEHFGNRSSSLPANVVESALREEVLTNRVMWWWMGERLKCSWVDAGGGLHSLDKRRESFILQEVLMVRDSGTMRMDDSSRSLL